jgi:hypothetical protein
MDVDIDAEFVGQPLQSTFPQPHARSVAAATVGGDRQVACVGIALATDSAPPTADRLHGEFR